jgi:hypothetical protein
MILFAFIVSLLPINSFADNPIVFLKDKVQDTFSTTFNNKDNNERLDHTSEDLDDSEKKTNKTLLDSKVYSATDASSEVEVATVKAVSAPAEDKKHFLWVLKHALLPN